jgi:hypothetical protein
LKRDWTSETDFWRSNSLFNSGHNPLVDTPDGKKRVDCVAHSSLSSREQIIGSRIVLIEFE